MDQALRAHTINGARQLGRDQDLGTIEVGKLADLVELSADPMTVDPHGLTSHVKVRGTWVSGRKVDLPEVPRRGGGDRPRAAPAAGHHGPAPLLLAAAGFPSGTALRSGIPTVG